MNKNLDDLLSDWFDEADAKQVDENHVSPGEASERAEPVSK
jgi:hypothetical protein